MHKIVFACVALETVEVIERFYLPLRLFGTLAVHIALLLQALYLLSPFDKLHDTLVTDEDIDDQKDDEGKHIFTPFPYLDSCPEVRKTHFSSNLAAKLHFFLHISKFFCTFVAEFTRNVMKKRLSLLVTVFFALSSLAQVHISASDPDSWSVQSALGDYVGQTVIFDDPVVVCNNANGNLLVSPWRIFEPENQGLPGSVEYNRTVHINGSCSFSLTGVSGYHRCGEKIYNLKAVVNSTNKLTWQGGKWVGNSRSDLEKGIPDLGDYRLLVCAFNIENYFMTWGSMGADSWSQHQDQREKVRKALKQINADIFGLVELQLGNEAINEIVSDLNENLPERHYRFFNDTETGTSQKVDFVYDANVVEPIGTPTGTDAENIPNRKKMICFREKATGEKFIYSINHFKSMNTGDEYRRVNEAKAVVKMYKDYRNDLRRNGIKDHDVLFMGDFNCHAKTEPMFVFTDAGMIDLHRAFHADSSYSYRMRNASKTSYIDQALSNETLYPQITGMAAYHINSDEEDRYNYKYGSDLSMFRCSDHDPVLVGLKLDSTLVFDPTPQINTEEVISGKADKLIIQNAHKEGKNSYYAIYNVSGVLQEQAEILSAYYEIPLPTAPGMYVVYVYFDGVAYQRRLIVR